MRTALGIHVFAGGFSSGVAKRHRVVMQLESHGFGLSTAERVWGIPTTNCPPADWPLVEADWAFGNPRCTGFSCVTAGYGAESHGPEAKQCQDIHDLVQYARGRFQVIVWESVQQAYSAAGRPLVESLGESLARDGYRVTHLLVNAHSFGNTQCRRRYFFIAHPANRPFNVELPSVSTHYPVLYDALWGMRDRQTREFAWTSDEYDCDSHVTLTPDEKLCVPYLATGWSHNQLAQYGYDFCPPKTREIWDMRTSGMPFSMHCISRTSWFRPCPTLKSTSSRLIHPWLNRPLTVGELATCMGWGDKIPVGRDPCAQIAKGVVPAIGEWLARQVDYCLDDAWGGEDWALRYDHHLGEFVGEDASGQVQKCIDLTHYHGKQFDMSRYDPEARKQFHRFNVDPATGMLRRDWSKIHAKV